MFCRSCGKEVAAEEPFCQYCGAKNETIAPAVHTEDAAKPTAGQNNHRTTRKTLLSVGGVFVLALVAFLTLFKTTALGSYIKLLGVRMDHSLHGSDSIPNPVSAGAPLDAVVKIIVNRGTNREKSGSGLVFTADGYVLTNAHVVTSEVGKPIDAIKICYSKNGQNPRCDWDAHFVDGDRYQDIAVLKIDGELGEIKPYFLVVNEDEEALASNTLPIGDELTAVGYPGLGRNTITVTKGIVAGYAFQILPFLDGAFVRTPHFVKTDSEINPGNSGGASFDKWNRYIGIPSRKDAEVGGKISYIIYYYDINRFLNRLVSRGDLELPAKQIKKKIRNTTETAFFEAHSAYLADDYQKAELLFEEYVKLSPDDARGWHLLCQTYVSNMNLGKLPSCIENLRRTNPQAEAMSLFLTAAYNDQFEENTEKALVAIDMAVQLDEDNTTLLNEKTRLEIKLDKISEAEVTNDLAFRTDEYDGDVWKYAALIAWQKLEDDEDIADVISLLEGSFELKPTAQIANILAIYYSESNDGADVALSLKYRVQGLILDPYSFKNLSGIAALLINALVDDGIEATNDSMATIRDVLEGVELDKKMILTISNIPDSKLIEDIKYETEVAEVSAADLTHYRNIIQIVSSWLYAFIGEKELCLAKPDLDIKALTDSLVATGTVDPEDQKTFALRYVLMSCLCSVDDAAGVQFGQCLSDAGGHLCRPDKLFSTVGICVSADQYCKESYGVNSVLGPENTCHCAKGYIFNADKTACIGLTAYCESQYGPSSYGLANGNCACAAGYAFNSEQTYCISLELACFENDLVAFNGQCVTRSESCDGTWPGSEWKGNYNEDDAFLCECRNGLDWDITDSSCIDINKICREQFGPNSYYMRTEGTKYLCS